MLLPNLLSARPGGQNGEVPRVIFQRNKAWQRTLGPNIPVPAMTPFSGVVNSFISWLELSTMNSNNSALCLPDSLVKPTEQKVTNRRIPGKRGVAHRLKLTTSPQVSNLYLSHRKNSEAKSNPWAKFIVTGKRRGENKHLESTAAVSHSLLTAGPDRECIHSSPSAWRGKSVFNAKLLFAFSFLSFRPALSSPRKQGLRVSTCDPNFPFCVRLF